MRGRLPTAIAAVAVGLTLVALAQAQGQRVSPAQDESGNSAVRIEAHFPRKPGVSQGSGFFFFDDATIVTALHVVAGSNAIQIFAEKPDGTFEVSDAEFQGAIYEADLAVLRVLRDTPRRPPLRAAPTRVGLPVYIFGYPGTPRMRPSASLIQGGRDSSQTPTLGQLGTSDLSRQMSTQGYPSPGALAWGTKDTAHGYSGAPVLDSEGHVVAIVEGGLFSGADPVTGFSIAAAPYLTARDRFTEPNPERPSMIGEMMASVTREEDVQVSVDSQSDAPNLRHEWRVPIQTLIDTLPAVDPNRRDNPALRAELQQILGRSAPMDTLVDVYHEEDMHAAIVVPSDAPIYPRGGGFVEWQSPTPRVRLMFKFAKGRTQEDGWANMKEYSEGILRQMPWLSLSNGAYDIPRPGIQPDRYVVKIEHYPEPESPLRPGRFKVHALNVQPNRRGDATDFLGAVAYLEDASHASPDEVGYFMLLSECVRLAVLN